MNQNLWRLAFREAFCFKAAMRATELSVGAVLLVGSVALNKQKAQEMGFYH